MFKKLRKFLGAKKDETKQDNDDSSTNYARNSLRTYHPVSNDALLSASDEALQKMTEFMLREVGQRLESNYRNVFFDVNPCVEVVLDETLHQRRRVAFDAFMDALDE